MFQYKQSVENRKANKFTFIYTLDKFINFSLFFGAILTGYFLISYLLRKNDEMMTDFYRKKLDKVKENN